MLFFLLDNAALVTTVAVKVMLNCYRLIIRSHRLVNKSKRTRQSGIGSLVSDALFRGRLSCFRICLIESFIVLPMIVNVFVAFHKRGIVFFV